MSATNQPCASMSAITNGVRPSDTANASHAQPLAQHAGRGTAREHRAAAADPVAAQVHGLAGEGAVGVGVDRAACRSHEVWLRELGLGRRRQPREHENGGTSPRAQPFAWTLPDAVAERGFSTRDARSANAPAHPLTSPDAARHLPRQPPLHPRRRARRRAGARLRRRDHDRVALRRGARAHRLGPPAQRPPPPRSRPHPALRARLLRLRGARRGRAGGSAAPRSPRPGTRRRSSTSPTRPASAAPATRSRARPTATCSTSSSRSRP